MSGGLVHLPPSLAFVCAKQYTLLNSFNTNRYHSEHSQTDIIKVTVNKKYISVHDYVNSIPEEGIYPNIGNYRI